VTASLPVHLQQIHSLMESSDNDAADPASARADADADANASASGSESVPSSVSELLALLAFFQAQSVPAGRRLWRQGDPSDCALLLVSGLLRFELEDEAGTTETGQGCCAHSLDTYLTVTAAD